MLVHLAGPFLGLPLTDLRAKMASGQECLANMDADRNGITKKVDKVNSIVQDVYVFEYISVIDIMNITREINPDECHRTLTAISQHRLR